MIRKIYLAAATLIVAGTLTHAADLPAETAAPFKPGEVVAFPGAEGAGRWTIGGRGGKVYEVTSLEDSGPGTFREACEASGPRVVIFRKGGVIHLKEKLTIKNPYITIAGQSAPGGGICIANRPFWINTYQVVIRYVRVRMGRGDKSTAQATILDDAFGGRPVSDIIIDHVSASWGHDENLSLYKMDDVNNDGKVPATERVTVQWSIIGEAMGHRFHPYGTVFGGKNATYHHNLFACNVSWEPYKVIENPNRPISLKPAPEDLNLVNNVFFVWLNRGLEGGGSGNINIINNYFIPDMDPYVNGREFRMINKIGSETGGKRCRHMAGNVMQGRAGVTADNWSNVEGSIAQVKSETPFDMFQPVNIESAEKAYVSVLEKAGATLPKRDNVDDRIVDATKNQKSYYLPIEIQQVDFYPFKVEGIVDFPKYDAGIPPADDDRDGIPNDWEVSHGLDPRNSNDGAQIKEGYSNLEWYLNDLVNAKTSIGTRYQTVKKASSVSQSIMRSVTVSSSKVSFHLEQKCDVSLKMFDINGRRLPDLFNGEMTAGYHEIPVLSDMFSRGLHVIQITAGKHTMLTQHIR